MHSPAHPVRTPPPVDSRSVVALAPRPAVAPRPALAPALSGRSVSRPEGGPHAYARRVRCVLV